MAHQVPWNKYIVDTFITEGMLSSDEAFIIRTRAMGWTVTQQALAINKSTSVVHNMISVLKKKYDAVQKYNPTLPERKSSAKETYMDTH